MFSIALRALSVVGLLRFARCRFIALCALSVVSLLRYARFGCQFLFIDAGPLSIAATCALVGRERAAEPTTREAQ
jgi:hypothetical protein